MIKTPLITMDVVLLVQSKLVTNALELDLALAQLNVEIP